jgi:hypothetical protein
MSSFDMNDEIIFKAKYLKYKNKYINLKVEQEGGITFDDSMIVILYESESVPELVAIKDEYTKASSTEEADITVDGKKMSLDTYLEKDFTLPLEALNGLPNLYQYKTAKKKYSEIISPLLTYNFDSQNKLLECTKSSGYNLATLGFKSKDGLNLKELANLVTRYNTDKQHVILLSNEEKTAVNPITDINLSDVSTKGRGKRLIDLVNNHGSSRKERENTYSTIVSEYLKKFTNTFNENLQSKKMNKGFILSEEGGKISVKLNNINSYMVVKNFKYNAGKKVFTFKVINPGAADSSAAAPAQGEPVEPVVE